MTNNPELSQSGIQRHLEKVIHSDGFRGSRRLRNLLSFLVERVLRKPEEPITPYEIAVDFLGRDPSFDPRKNAIVRVTTLHLRNCLDHYYLSDGKRDPIRIRIPKRSYTPEFTSRIESPPSDPPAPTSSEPLNISIAVVQFSSTNPDTHKEATRQIFNGTISYLSRYPEIRTFTVSSPLDEAVDSARIRDIAHRLSADYVITGTLNDPDEGEHHAHLNLWDGANGSILWHTPVSLPRRSNSFWPKDRQQAMAMSIATAIADYNGLLYRLASQSIDTGVDGEQDNLLRSIQGFYTRFIHWDISHHKRLIKSLESLREEHPEDPTLLSFLAWMYADDACFCIGAVPDGLRKAGEIIDLSISANPLNHIAWHVKAFTTFLMKDPSWSSSAMHAISLNPGAVLIQALTAVMFANSGEFEQARAILSERPEALSHNLPTFSKWIDVAELYHEKRYKEAAEKLEDFSFRGNPWHHIVIAAVQAQAGQLEAAHKELHALQLRNTGVKAHPYEMLRQGFFDPEIAEHYIQGLRLAGMPDPAPSAEIEQSSYISPG